MPLFKVEIERPMPRSYDGKPTNPFHKALILGETVTMSIRSWKFEADDEAAVRAFFKDAQEKDLPHVRGYQLRSITKID